MRPAPTYAPETQRLQIALTLFAALWQLVNGWMDWRAGQYGFCAIEWATGAACLLIGVLIWQRRMNLTQLGWGAITLAFLAMGAVLVDDFKLQQGLSAYAYMNATITVGLAFALFNFSPALWLVILSNLALVAGALVSGRPNFTLVTGQLFISALFAYGVFHNRHTLNTLEDRMQTEQDMDEMANRDPVTGLMSAQGMNIHLRRLWPGLDDHQRTYSALVKLRIRNFPEVTATYGCEAGNQVLQQVTVHLLQGSNLNDLTARGEGPTFLLLLLNVKRRDVTARLEQLQERLTGTLWVGGPSITLEGRYALLSEADSPEELIPLLSSMGQQATKPA